MKNKTLNILNDLKSSPCESEADHLLLLRQLYWEYSDGLTALQPIMDYYLNGLDDLPSLQEKEKWNEERFNQIRKPFTDSHSQLVVAIEKVLIKIQ